MAASLLVSGASLWRLKTRQGTYKIAALCLWLGAYACLANAAILSPFIEPELATLGINLALYVGVPMAALVMLDVALGWHWQRATWGRIFLGLAAMFELMRRAEAGNTYAEFMLMACILALLFAVFKILKLVKLKGQSIAKPGLILSLYLAFMVASLGSLNSGFALLWNAATLLTFGGYLYLSA